MSKCPIEADEWDASDDDEAIVSQKTSGSSSLLFKSGRNPKTYQMSSVVLPN
jgi:hypothetical protein